MVTCLNNDMYPILAFLRRHLPRSIFHAYHRSLSWLAAMWYGYPSEDLIVIGVTGTSGKTTTCYLIAKALEGSGARVGCSTTAFFKIAEREWTNETKMTMVGRFQLQRLLREMVEAGCRYAVIETTSQGIEQYRHEQIAYDVCLLTNLWPEHIEAHGGFEQYKAAKKKLITHTARLPRKVLGGTSVPRALVLNAMNEHAPDFLSPGFDTIAWYTTGNDVPPPTPGDASIQVLSASDVVVDVDATRFSVDGVAVQLQLPGAPNVENALAALAVVRALHIPLNKAAAALARAPGLAGRYERIDQGQPFTVIVDYAFEPRAMEKLYDLATQIPHERIIHVLGGTGGGRDASRRPVLGKIAGMRAQIVIVTNEDPYDEDPRAIINQVAEGALVGGKVDGEDLFRVDDRAAAIQMAVKTARPKDLVLITGKGSEPVMAIAGGQKIPWSDAEEVRKAIAAL
jgi:UDP-N-acetylmuramoyl-L-alanyl-D-glutamate--2,6-diaminopimelate ligase